MKHKPKTGIEAKRFLAYMRRSTIIEKAEKILSLIFPGRYPTGLYSYPEVKIFNYLDTEYYGYLSQTIIVMSPSVHQVRTSELCSIPAHRTCGSPIKSADCLPPAISTICSIARRAAAMFVTAPSSTLLMGLELSLDIWESTPLELLD
jgi:hypothetical protein